MPGSFRKTIPFLPSLSTHDPTGSSAMTPAARHNTSNGASSSQRERTSKQSRPAAAVTMRMEVIKGIARIAGVLSS